MKKMDPSSRQSYRDYRVTVKQRLAKAKAKSSPTHAAEKGRDEGEWDSERSERTRSFWTLIARFWAELGVFRWKVLFGLSTLTFSTLMGLIPPLATKLAIDCALSKPASPLPWFLPASWQTLTPMQLLTTIALTAVALTLGSSAIHLWGRWVSTQAVNQLQATLRRRVFQHILHLPLHRIQAIKSGGATSLIREDAGGVAELIFSMLYNPWAAIVQLLGSLFVLVLVDWKLLACGLLLLPAVYFSHRAWIHQIRPLFRDVRSQRQRVDASATETFGGIRVVRTFARQLSETKRFAIGNHMLVRQQLMVWWKTRIVELVWEVIIPVASTGLLLYGGWQILGGLLTLGDLLMFLVYLTMLLGPVATLTGSAAQFQNNLAGFERVLDLLEEAPEMQDRPNASMASRRDSHGLIRVEDLGFQYPGSEAWVLRGIQAVIEPGQTVALVGRSGAGKTTFCNLIARFFDPTEGRITLDGVDLRDLQLHSFRRLLGVVEQDVFLFDGTIGQNIAYGRRLATENEIVEAARMAAAWEFIEKLPKGLDTRIGERGVKLSGGQRQRLAIARAILADPKILILDEATSNLDSESEQAIQQSLSVLMKNRTSFVIAHRLSTIIAADQILVLDEGRIVQRGTHAELVASEGPYQRMVRIQMNSPIVE